NFNFSNIFEWNIKQRVNGRNIKIPHNLTLLFKSYMTPNQVQNSNYFSLEIGSGQFVPGFEDQMLEQEQKRNHELLMHKLKQEIDDKKITLDIQLGPKGKI
ncbi:hypothetical protein ACMUE1_00925, partial [Candidatus Phytoplasma asteris]